MDFNQTFFMARSIIEQRGVIAKIPTINIPTIYVWCISSRKVRSGVEQFFFVG